MQPAHAFPAHEDAALAADLRQHLTVWLVSQLHSPAAEELLALVRGFGGLQIGTAEELQAFIKDRCPNLHAELKPSTFVGLFGALGFLHDPRRFSASVQAVRRYVYAHHRLRLVLQAMDANGGADGPAIARFFAVLMQLHKRISGARLVKIVLNELAKLPGMSSGALETGSGMTLATAARLLLVHHVLGTKPCRKPNRKSASLAPKRRRPVYEDFMEAARNLPTVDGVLLAMSRGTSVSAPPPSSSSSWSLPSYPPASLSAPSSWPAVIAAPSHNINGRRFREESSSEADYSDSGSSFGSSSFVDDEQPRSKSPRTVWDLEAYGVAESKDSEVSFVFNAQEQEQVEQEIISHGLFYGLDNGFSAGFSQLSPLPVTSEQLLQQPIDAQPVQQATEDVVTFNGVFEFLCLSDELQAQVFDALEDEDNDNDNVADRQEDLDEFTQDLDLDQLTQLFDEDLFDDGNNDTRGAGSY